MFPNPRSRNACTELENAMAVFKRIEQTRTGFRGTEPTKMIPPVIRFTLATFFATYASRSCSDGEAEVVSVRTT